MKLMIQKEKLQTKVMNLEEEKKKKVEFEKKVETVVLK